MAKEVRAKPSIRARVRQLRSRVAELEETLQAIRSGRVDAVVVNTPSGDQVFTLQGAEHPYRVLVESIQEGAATLDAHGTVLYANLRFAEIFDTPLSKLIGTDLMRCCPEQERDHLQELFEGGRHEVTTGEIRLQDHKGKRRVIRLSFSPGRDSDAKSVCVIGMDLTELSEANEALTRSERDLRILSNRLIQLQDEERRRISRELHDTTGQKLIGLCMGLSWVLKNANVKLPSGEKQRLTECFTLANEAGNEIRTLSYLLHPPLLEELGLAAGIRWYAEGFEDRTGIHVQINIPQNFIRLASDAELALFRIVQESLTNVHRYARSSTAIVRLRVANGQVKLEIVDHGIGIPDETFVQSESVRTLGVGIQGMRERMRQLSGQLRVGRARSGGTVVTATLPITPVSMPKARSQTQVTSGAPTEANPQVSTAVKTILIADDHDVLRQGVRSMLENENGWKICGEAVNGHEAVEKAAALHPDLVVLDLNMPDMDGFAAIPGIVQHHPEAKILVFSVHNSYEVVDQVMAAGAHGYLCKADAGQELVNAVRNVLNGKPFYLPRYVSQSMSTAARR